MGQEQNRFPLGAVVNLLALFPQLTLPLVVQYSSATTLPAGLSAALAPRQINAPIYVATLINPLLRANVLAVFVKTPIGFYWPAAGERRDRAANETATEKVAMLC